MMMAGFAFIASILMLVYPAAFLTRAVSAAALTPKDEGIANSDDSIMNFGISELAQSLQDQIATCPRLPPRKSPPAHARDVRPDDISVVIAMGDSVIAGFNSRYKHDPLFADPKFLSSIPYTEFRGTNFVNGGDDDAFSVGKIISSMRAKQARPEVYGLARGSHHATICFGPLCPAGTFMAPFFPDVAGLNAAQTGSWVSQGNINNQFKYLDRYYDDIVPQHHQEEDDETKAPWKLLIYDIGFNNLCFVCSPLANYLQFSADIYERNVRYMLEEVRSRYANIIVMLLGPFDIVGVKRVTETDSVCNKINNVGFQACYCLSDHAAASRHKVTEMAAEYNRRLATIAADYSRINHRDFGVVYESGFGQAESAQTDVLTDLSGRDCYHPTVYSHARNAANLWNNLVLPQSQKLPYRLLRNMTLMCLEEHHRISLD